MHFAFDAMVGIGFALLALGAWLAWTLVAAPRTCRGTRWFLRAVAVSGVAAVVAMEAGWVATEVGRQPWIVYGSAAHRRRGQPGAGAVRRRLRRCSPSTPC